jgi:KaiC/GvpD/RAD55 family RecA-like ATPase
MSVLPMRDPRDKRERPHPLSVLADQVGGAQHDVSLDAELYGHFPWPSLDAVVSGLPPGAIWFVAGFSGNGKTTFLTSLCYEWVMQGVGVYYLGLESPGEDIRLRFACHEVGAHFGEIKTGQMAARGDTDTEKQVRAALQRQVENRNRFPLFVAGDAFLSTRTLIDACEEAQMQCHASVVVIDHIDHIRAPESRGAWDESVQVCHAILEIAKRTGLRFLIATQTNLKAFGRDPLAIYRAPQGDDVKMGNHKREIAHGMLGLYRPIRDDVTKDEIKAVREDRAEARTILEPHTMGVVCMKHRYLGAHEGRRIKLHVERGRVVEPRPTDLHSSREFGYGRGYDAPSR